MLYTLCSSGVLSNMATSNSRVQEISWVQTEKEYKVALKIIKKRICTNCVNSYFLIWTMYMSARLRAELLPNRDPILYRISTIFLAKWLRNSDGIFVSSCSGHLKGKVEKNVLILYSSLLLLLHWYSRFNDSVFLKSVLVSNIRTAANKLNTSTTDAG